MTTGQLVEILKQFKPDTPVYLAKHNTNEIPLNQSIYLKMANIRIIGTSAKQDPYNGYDNVSSVDFEVADTCIIG